MQIKLLWVTDPWNTLTPLQDTTLRLAHEAQNMGFLSFWAGSDIVTNTSLTQIQCIPLTGDFAPLSTKPFEKKPSEFRQIHYRVDPPVDFNYISTIEKIVQRGAQVEQILNPVRLITGMSEKLPPPDLMHFAPRSLIVKKESDVGAALSQFSKDARIVTKPMNLAQSQGVKRWELSPGNPSIEEIIRVESENFSRPILVQEYLPQIDEGEVRLWFAQGKFIAALKKFPKSGDFRVLIDEGSKVTAYELNDREIKIAEAIGVSLAKLNIALAAIDLIGEKISDFNITSPGLLVQLEQVHGGKNFAREILKEILR